RLRRSWSVREGGAVAFQLSLETGASSAHKPFDDPGEVRRMDVFRLRDQVIQEYHDYVRSFIQIKDARTARYVEEQLGQGRLWPDPLVQLNPSFEPGETVEVLVARGMLAEECGRIFRRSKDAAGFGPSLRLHRHQQEAVQVAATGESYVLTTGTGS